MIALRPKDGRHLRVELATRCHRFLEDMNGYKKARNDTKQPMSGVSLCDIMDGYTSFNQSKQRHKSRNTQMEYIHRNRMQNGK